MKNKDRESTNGRCHVTFQLRMMTMMMKVLQLLLLRVVCCVLCVPFSSHWGRSGSQAIDFVDVHTFISFLIA